MSESKIVEENCRADVTSPSADKSHTSGRDNISLAVDENIILSSLYGPSLMPRETDKYAASNFRIMYFSKMRPAIIEMQRVDWNAVLTRRSKQHTVIAWGIQLRRASRRQRLAAPVREC